MPPVKWSARTEPDEDTGPLGIAPQSPTAAGTRIQNPGSPLGARLEQHLGSDTFPACSFATADCVRVPKLSRSAPQVSIFYLDTGLLFAQTNATRHRLVQRYQVAPIRVEAGLSLAEQQAAYRARIASRPCAVSYPRSVRCRASLRSGTAGLPGSGESSADAGRGGRARVEWQVWADQAQPPGHLGQTRRVGVCAGAAGPYNPLHNRGYPSIGRHRALGRSAPARIPGPDAGPGLTSRSAACSPERGRQVARPPGAGTRTEAESGANSRDQGRPADRHSARPRRELPAAAAGAKTRPLPHGGTLVDRHLAARRPGA